MVTIVLIPSNLALKKFGAKRFLPVLMMLCKSSEVYLMNPY